MTEPRTPRTELRELMRCPECGRTTSVPPWCKRPVCVHAWEGNTPEIWDDAADPLSSSPEPSWREEGEHWRYMVAAAPESGVLRDALTWQERANSGTVDLPPKAAELCRTMPDDFFGLILEVMDEAAALANERGHDSMHTEPAGLDVERLARAQNAHSMYDEQDVPWWFCRCITLQEHAAAIAREYERDAAKGDTDD